MIGKQTTLRDIVLEERPEPVSLICHETLDEEELSLRPYKFSVNCFYCPRELRIVVQSTPGGSLTLQDLLLHDLTFVCVGCAREHHYNGR